MVLINSCVWEVPCPRNFIRVRVYMWPSNKVDDVNSAYVRLMFQPGKFGGNIDASTSKIYQVGEDGQFKARGVKVGWRC